MTYSWLPELLRDVAEAAGLDAALALARAAGGRRVDIPARARDGHWLVEAVGREAADRICAHFRTISADGRENGARQVVVPIGPNSVGRAARRQLIKDLEAGKSARVAAAAAGLHERTAWYIKRKLKLRPDRDQAQPSLFDAGPLKARRPRRG